ncbi:MAG: helix-turn-helix domain-containing protein [Cyanobacteria bacterium P01_E01_bin.34]
MKNHAEIMAQLPLERQKAIKQKAQELIAQEMTLRELRKSLGLRQEDIADILDKGQDEISRLENRTDWLISTLKAYVEAMGGNLQLTAVFPDRDPIDLSSIAESKTSVEQSLPQT